MMREVILTPLIFQPFTGLITAAEHYIVYNQGRYFESIGLPISFTGLITSVEHCIVYDKVSYFKSPSFLILYKLHHCCRAMYNV